jgi:DNA-nicking Smr family endonuclease
VVKKPAKNQTHTIAPADVALFRAAIGDVKLLAKQNRITPRSVPRKPLLNSPNFPAAIPDTLSDFVPENVPVEYLSNGLSRMTLRKLRCGSWPIQDSLDLHGSSIDEARKLLQEFLHKAAQRNWRCVLVIHGKGLNSQGGEAVLRKLARHWLTQHQQVLGYCDAPSKDGGSGAALALLKITL